jgi:DNA polymerase type B, organellar and viral
MSYKKFVEPQYNVGQWATRQRSLGLRKLQWTQERWIVVSGNNDTFSARALLRGVDGRLECVAGDSDLPWSEFFSLLRSITLDRSKWWVIGWGMRAALSRVDLFGSLERGTVALPRNKKGKKAMKRSGSLTLSYSCLDVDLVCGRNSIKIVDFDQFGVLLSDFGVVASEVTQELSERALADMLYVADATGLCVSRPTAAQVGHIKMRDCSGMDKLCVNHDFDARSLERAAYYGGRCECFRVGDMPSQAYSLDIRSCYASICASCYLPYYLDREFRAGCDVGLIKNRFGQQWIAEVIVRTDSPDYPVKAQIGERDSDPCAVSGGHPGGLAWSNHTIYPTGEFRTTLPWPELWHAIQRKRVVRVLRAAVYKSLPVLQHYAECYYWMRDLVASSERKHMATFVKAVFNASLGYTARQRYGWVQWTTGIDRRWYTGITRPPDGSSVITQMRGLDGEEEWLRVGGEPRDAMPFLHATICSYARVKLLEIFDAAGKGNVWYCDTDGVLVNEVGRANLIAAQEFCGEEPGMLRERFVPGRCRILAPKNYRVGDNWVTAGQVRTRASKFSDGPVLDVTSGRVDSHGILTPYVMECSDEGDQQPFFQNRIL